MISQPASETESPYRDNAIKFQHTLEESFLPQLQQDISLFTSQSKSLREENCDLKKRVESCHRNQENWELQQYLDDTSHTISHLEGQLVQLQRDRLNKSLQLKRVLKRKEVEANSEKKLLQAELQKKQQTLQSLHEFSQQQSALATQIENLEKKIQNESNINATQIQLKKKEQELKIAENDRRKAIVSKTDNWGVVAKLSRLSLERMKFEIMYQEREMIKMKERMETISEQMAAMTVQQQQQDGNNEGGEEDDDGSSSNSRQGAKYICDYRKIIKTLKRQIEDKLNNAPLNDSDDDGHGETTTTTTAAAATATRRAIKDNMVKCDRLNNATREMAHMKHIMDNMRSPLTKLLFEVGASIPELTHLTTPDDKLHLKTTEDMIMMAKNSMLNSSSNVHDVVQNMRKEIVTSHDNVASEISLEKRKDLFHQLLSKLYNTPCSSGIDDATTATVINAKDSNRRKKHTTRGHDDCMDRFKITLSSPKAMLFTGRRRRRPQGQNQTSMQRPGTTPTSRRVKDVIPIATKPSTAITAVAVETMSPPEKFGRLNDNSMDTLPLTPTDNIKTLDFSDDVTMERSTNAFRMFPIDEKEAIGGNDQNASSKNIHHRRGQLPLRSLKTPSSKAKIKNSPYYPAQDKYYDEIAFPFPTMTTDITTQNESLIKNRRSVKPGRVLSSRQQRQKQHLRKSHGSEDCAVSFPDDIISPYKKDQRQRRQRHPSDNDDDGISNNWKKRNKRPITTPGRLSQLEVAGQLAQTWSR